MANELEGLEEVLRTLDELTPKIKEKAVRRAMLNGANQIKKTAVSYAPSDKGVMKKNIRTQYMSKVFRSSGGNDLGYRIGVSNPKGGYSKSSSMSKKEYYRSVQNSYYFKFVEFGTKKMSAKPFLRPALENNVSSITENTAKMIEQAIEQILSKNKG